MSNYTWTVSTGGSITAGSTTNDITVTWTTTGAKTVTATYTDLNGCNPAAPTSKTVNVYALPVPTITGPGSICGIPSAGNVYSTEAGMTGYAWTVSAGGTVTAGTGTNSITVTWTTTGANTVSVNYTNGNGCTATSPTTYNVTVNPLPVPTITGPANACIGVAGNIYTTEAGMSNYLWTVSAGGTITAEGGVGNNTVTVTWTTTGAKTVAVNYTNGNGCTATSPTTYNVTVNPLPVPTLAGPASVCFGAGGNIYTTEAGMSNYLWTVSAGGTITAGGGTGNNTVTVTWTTEGAKTVTVNYTNGNGCTATSLTTYNVTVNPLPVPTITGPTPVCAGIAGNVYAAEAGMSNYIWTVSAGGTITAGGGTGDNTVTVTWTTAGSKTVSVNYTDGNGCTATSPMTYYVTVNPLPVPTIAGPAPICVGIAGNVYTTEAGMSNYIWTVSAGGTITAGGGTGDNTVSVTWTTTGAKTVTANYTNGNGCTATSPTIYSVTVNPLPVPTLAGPTPVCVGVAGNVYTTEAGMSNYLWTVSAGGTITAGGGIGDNTVTVTWTTTGTKAVTINYTNVNGCSATSPATYNVTVNALPVATASNNGPICAGSALSLTGGPASMATYSWTGPDGFTSLLQNPSVSANVTIAMAGVYTLAVTDGNGCTNTATTTVVVNALPVGTASNNGPVCAGSALSLTGGPGGMTTYSWTGPGGFTSNLQSPSVSASATLAMTGVYTLTVIDVSGCTNTATTTITVNVLPVTTASNNGPVCAGSALSLTGVPAGMTTYSWTGPDSFTSALQSSSVSASAAAVMAGVYTLTVTNGSGCTNTATTTVVVNALPVLTASNNGPVCAGSALSLTGGPSGMTTFSWTGPDGFTSALQSPSVSAGSTASMAGIYTLTVTNASGCTNTATTTVAVNALPLVNITSSSSSMCINDLRTLTGSPAGGMFIISDGPGTITGNVLSATGTGNINLVYTYTNVCTNKATQSIIVNENPIAIAGQDQELKFVFETRMNAELSSSETGEWSLISGSGHISDIHSPTTMITELSTGENIFLWKVRNGNCEASAKIKITVYDLFVPSVITPDGDGKNDYFKIIENIGQVELIIFNRWGNEEYTNGNYLNDWDGRNNKGAELPNDTYFYVLIFENGKIKKGSVLIKR
jgi:gliding motility-associated-like protein